MGDQGQESGGGSSGVRDWGWKFGGGSLGAGVRGPGALKYFSLVWIHPE